MSRRYKKVISSILVLLWVSLCSSCQPSQSQEGIHVMFEGEPKIYHPEVFFHGRAVGEIQAKVMGNGFVSRITIHIDPQYEQYAGRHWVFYVDNGRLTAGRINGTGEPIRAGDRVCGFQSKAAFQWFKVKTLLSDRISTANRRADKLFQRFSQSA